MTWMPALRRSVAGVLAAGFAVFALGLVPFLGSGYHLAVAIGLLSHLVLATAWALFSGSTRYVSLATVAFFGIGAYTVAVLGEVLPWPVVLLTATAIGIAVAMLVGLSTQRLSGVYFVIFSFGLAELTRRFGGLVAVNGLSMTVEPSEIVGLIGPNGSGITTALNLLSGALKPDSGAVRLAGKAIDGLPAHKIARLGLARTFQLVRVLPSLDCVENVKAGLAFRERPLWGEAATEEAILLLRRVGLGGKVDHSASQLTYIDQKRLELARALALAPKLLLLDEWLAGLNPSELQDGIALIHSLRDEGLAIILVEHVMDAIRSLCDRCVVMSAGTMIAAGPPASVRADAEVSRAYLGDPDA